MDGEQIRSVTWEAPEHWHDVKSSDWFWVLGGVTVVGAVLSIVLGNTLLGILILIAGAIMAILANREAEYIPYAVTQRGLRIEDTLYPYSTLESFFIDEEHPMGPMLLVQSEKIFMPLIIIPLPEEYLDDIEDILANRLPEEHLEEPLANKVLEFFGF